MSDVSVVGRVLAEVRREMRDLRKAVEEKSLPEIGAVPYKTAAKMLGVHVSEAKAMVKQGLLLPVVYGPGKHPKIPLSEIRRLTTPELPPMEAPRGKPSRKRTRASGFMSPEQLEEAIKEMR